MIESHKHVNPKHKTDLLTASPFTLDDDKSIFKFAQKRGLT